MKTEELNAYDTAKFEVLAAFNKVWQLPFEEQQQLLEYVSHTISTRMEATVFSMQPGANVEIVSDK